MNRKLTSSEKTTETTKKGREGEEYKPQSPCPISDQLTSNIHTVCPSSKALRARGIKPYVCLPLVYGSSSSPSSYPLKVCLQLVILFHLCSNEIVTLLHPLEMRFEVRKFDCRGGGERIVKGDVRGGRKRRMLEMGQIEASMKLSEVVFLYYLWICRISRAKQRSPFIRPKRWTNFCFCRNMRNKLS